MWAENEFYVSLIGVLAVFFGTYVLVRIQERRNRKKMFKAMISAPEKLSSQVKFIEGWIDVSKKETEFEMITDAIKRLEMLHDGEAYIKTVAADLRERLKAHLTALATERALDLKTV